jgi:hypothetical protein
MRRIGHHLTRLRSVREITGSRGSAVDRQELPAVAVSHQVTCTRWGEVRTDDQRVCVCVLGEKTSACGLKRRHVVSSLCYDRLGRMVRSALTCENARELLVEVAGVEPAQLEVLRLDPYNGHPSEASSGAVVTR